MESKLFSEDELFSFARYIWAKSMSDYSKGLTHYFNEWKEIQLEKKKLDCIPPDASNIECFAIKGSEAFIGFKISNGNFHYIQVPYTEPK